jgi:capsule polysaccharide export protein KpsE/RkpR
VIETFTYAALGERLGCTPEAARALAKRKRWSRTVGNDGKARVQVDLGEVNRPTVVPRVSELLAQVQSLKDELAKAERTAAGHRADFEHERDRCDRLAADLMKMTAERQSDQEQLAAARAAADKATAELVELARRLAAIAETQAAEPEPPRRRLGRAWGWFLRN